MAAIINALKNLASPGKKRSNKKADPDAVASTSDIEAGSYPDDSDLADGSVIVANVSVPGKDVRNEVARGKVNSKKAAHAVQKGAATEEYGVSDDAAGMQDADTDLADLDEFDVRTGTLVRKQEQNSSVARSPNNATKKSFDTTARNRLQQGRSVAPKPSVNNASDLDNVFDVGTVMLSSPNGPDRVITSITSHPIQNYLYPDSPESYTPAISKSSAPKQKNALANHGHKANESAQSRYKENIPPRDTSNLFRSYADTLTQPPISSGMPVPQIDEDVLTKDPRLMTNEEKDNEIQRLQVLLLAMTPPPGVDLARYSEASKIMHSRVNGAQSGPLADASASGETGTITGVRKHTQYKQALQTDTTEKKILDLSRKVHRLTYLLNKEKDKSRTLETKLESVDASTGAIVTAAGGATNGTRVRKGVGVSSSTNSNTTRSISRATGARGRMGTVSAVTSIADGDDGETVSDMEGVSVTQDTSSQTLQQRLQAAQTQLRSAKDESKGLLAELRACHKILEQELGSNVTVAEVLQQHGVHKSILVQPSRSNRQPASNSRNSKSDPPSPGTVSNAGDEVTGADASVGGAAVPKTWRGRAQTISALNRRFQLCLQYLRLKGLSEVQIRREIEEAKEQGTSQGNDVDVGTKAGAMVHYDNEEEDVEPTNPIRKELFGPGPFDLSTYSDVEEEPDRPLHLAASNGERLMALAKAKTRAHTRFSVDPVTGGPTDASFGIGWADDDNAIDAPVENDAASGTSKVAASKVNTSSRKSDVSTNGKITDVGGKTASSTASNSTNSAAGGLAEKSQPRSVRIMKLETAVARSQEATEKAEKERDVARARAAALEKEIQQLKTHLQTLLKKSETDDTLIESLRNRAQAHGGNHSSQIPSFPHPLPPSTQGRNNPPASAATVATQDSTVSGVTRQTRPDSFHSGDADGRMDYVAPHPPMHTHAGAHPSASVQHNYTPHSYSNGALHPTHPNDRRHSGQSFMERALETAQDRRTPPGTAAHADANPSYAPSHQYVENNHQYAPPPHPHVHPHAQPHPQPPKGTYGPEGSLRHHAPLPPMGTGHHHTRNNDPHYHGDRAPPVEAYGAMGAHIGHTGHGMQSAQSGPVGRNGYNADASFQELQARIETEEAGGVVDDNQGWSEWDQVPVGDENGEDNFHYDPPAMGPSGSTHSVLIQKPPQHIHHQHYPQQQTPQSFGPSSARDYGLSPDSAELYRGSDVYQSASEFDGYASYFPVDKASPQSYEGPHANTTHSSFPHPIQSMTRESVALVDASAASNNAFPQGQANYFGTGAPRKDTKMPPNRAEILKNQINQIKQSLN